MSSIVLLMRLYWHSRKGTLDVDGQKIAEPLSLPVDHCTPDCTVQSIIRDCYWVITKRRTLPLILLVDWQKRTHALARDSTCATGRASMRILSLVSTSSTFLVHVTRKHD